MLIYVKLPDIYLEPPVQAFSTFPPSTTNILGHKTSEKLLEILNIFDTYVNRDTNMQLLKYPISKEKKIPRLLIKDISQILTPKKFIILNKVVIPRQSLINWLPNLDIMKEIKNAKLTKLIKKVTLIDKLTMKKKEFYGNSIVNKTVAWCIGSKHKPVCYLPYAL